VAMPAAPPRISTPAAMPMMYRRLRDFLSGTVIKNYDENGRKDVQRRPLSALSCRLSALTTESRRLTAIRYRLMWILQCAEPDATFRLRPGAVKTVGRAPRADFIVDAALVSRLHCRITAAADKLEVVGLKSTNGTFVNGRRVAKAQIADGDTLRVGRVELTVRSAVNG